LIASAALTMTSLAAAPVALDATGASAAAQAPNPVLVAIRASHHSPAGRPAFDRVAFQFRGGLPSSVRVRYVKRVVADASGKRVRVPGRALLAVRLAPADAHDASGPTAPARVAFRLPNVMTAVRSGDFEAVTSYALGLAKRAPVHVVRLHHPSRIAVDVGAAFRTVPRRVWFFDSQAFSANQEPFFHAVRRPVLPQSPARAVLDRLFAGPLNSERAAGLRLLRSGATGLTGPTIRDGVARVRMTGGCSSGGSTVTLAGEVTPTLKQFPSVRWVKIYDPSGHTEHPRGHTDSIPTCLEP
jgi:hypothetical protein